MAKLITSAFDPVRADPQAFVDRREIFGELVEIVSDYVTSERYQARLALVGAKGVGKTMLTRALLAEVERSAERSFLLVEVDGRGLGYRPFLKKMARTLAERVHGTLPGDAHKSLLRWADELALLSLQDGINEAQTQSIARTYGADAGIEGGLFGTLQAKGLFRWTETRQGSAAVTRSREVTNDLLHTAIEQMLAALALAAVPVVVFFNDLDQAVQREAPEQLREAIGQLVSLEPCIQVVNLRTEVLYDDLQREFEVVHVPEMDSAALMELYDRRVTEERSEEKRRKLTSEPVLQLARQLSRVNGNPYAFLTWIQAALREFDFPPPPLDDQVRVRIVARARALPDQDLLRRAAVVVDHCGNWDDWCLRADLERGQRQTDTGAVAPLKAREIDHLVQAGVLVPRDVFMPEAGLRLETTLDLLRPSADKRVAG